MCAHSLHCGQGRTYVPHRVVAREFAEVVPLEEPVGHLFAGRLLADLAAQELHERRVENLLAAFRHERPVSDVLRPERESGDLVLAGLGSAGVGPPPCRVGSHLDG